MEKEGEGPHTGRRRAAEAVPNVRRRAHAGVLRAAAAYGDARAAPAATRLVDRQAVPTSRLSIGRAIQVSRTKSVYSSGVE